MKPNKSTPDSASSTTTADDSGLPEGGKVCIGCDRKINPQTDSLQCHNCDAWWHSRCAKIPKDDYKFLTENPLTSVKWFCERCRSKKSYEKTDEHTSKCDAKIDNITKVIQTMQTQLNTVQTQMTTILDLVNKKEARPDTDIMENIESKLNAHMEEMAKDQKERSEKSETKMQAHMEEMFKEQKEINEKRNNFIVYNMSENEENDEEKQKKDDISTLREILQVVLPSTSTRDITLNEATVQRCGIKKKDKTRPVRVKLEENSMKGKIFVNSWKLKEKEEFKRIGISNDKTYKELMKDRELRAKLQEKKDQTKEDDWIIYNGEIIKRAARPPRNKGGQAAQQI